MKNKTVKSFLALGVLLLTLTNTNLLGEGTRTIDPPVGRKQSISIPRTIDPPVGKR